ncbi:hypothetical protein ACN47E_002985 [Coniothyrium glycines]
MQLILNKLKNDPTAITTEDARRLSENHDAKDERSARIISAIEAYAVANEMLHELDPKLGQAPHTSLLTVVEDLNAAVGASPHEVTDEIFRMTQSIVSKMQKSIGHANAPHPEVEAELHEEAAKIEPKIAQGTVTKAEADHLHSLEARAHGHTEKGGVASKAQSVAAKRERQLSLSNGSSPLSGRSRANSRNFSLPHEQSRHDKEETLHRAEITIMPKIEQGTVTQADANVLQLREMRAHGYIEKGSSLATAQAVAGRKRQDTLSERSNNSLTEADYERRKEQSQHDKELTLSIADMVVEPKIKTLYISQGEAAWLQAREHRTFGHAEKERLAAEAMSKVHKRENSQPAVETP